MDNLVLWCITKPAGPQPGLLNQLHRDAGMDHNTSSMRIKNIYTSPAAAGFSRCIKMAPVPTNVAAIKSNPPNHGIALRTPMSRTAAAANMLLHLRLVDHRGLN